MNEILTDENYLSLINETEFQNLFNNTLENTRSIFNSQVSEVKNNFNNIFNIINNQVNL